MTRKKVVLTPEQIRLRKLEKILKNKYVSVLQFIITLGEVEHKELYKQHQQKLSDYLYYRLKCPFGLADNLEKTAIAFHKWFNVTK